MSRIDSQIELIKFLTKLSENEIELPDNLTLEIESSILQKSLIKSLSLVAPNVEVESLRGRFCGEKITFKPNDNEKQ